MFKIDVKNLCWIDGTLDDPNDLCLHGNATVKIGNEIFKYKATVSATALYLLKSLTEDHVIYNENQMLPCCGFFMISNDNLTNIDICGCHNGIDWTILHEGNKSKMLVYFVSDKEPRSCR